MNKIQNINLIKNNSIKKADFTNSSLNDEDCIKLAEALHSNNSVNTLTINNSLSMKKIYKYNYQFMVKNINNYKGLTKSRIENYFSSHIFNNINNGYNYIFDALKDHKTINKIKLNNIELNEDNLEYFTKILTNNNINTLHLKIYYSNPIYFNKLIEALNNNNNIYDFKIIISNDINEYQINELIHTLMHFNLLKLTVKFYNSFTQNNMNNLAELINKNDRITYLNLCYKHKYYYPQHSRLSIENIIKPLFNKKYLKYLKINNFDFCIGLNYFNTDQPNHNIELLTELLNKNKNITYLNISNNIINNLDPLMNILMNYQIKTLKLEHLSLINKNGIAKFIQTNNYITNLNISNICCYNEKNLSVIFNALMSNNTLLKLNISNINNIADINDLNEFIKMIENNKTLINLNINNCINDDNMLQILQALQHNEHLRKIKIKKSFNSNNDEVYNYNNNYVNEFCKILNYNKNLQSIYNNIDFNFKRYYLIGENNMNKEFINKNRIIQLENSNLLYNTLSNESYNKIKNSLINTNINLYWIDYLYHEKI